MVPLLTDENFAGPILRALQQREPSLDIVRMQDVGLTGADDLRILEWTSRHRRVLLTHDRETIPYFAYERIRKEEEMTGVVVVDDLVIPGKVVPEILRLVVENDLEKFENRVFFLSS